MVIIVEVILYLFLTCEIGYGSTNTPYYFLNLHNPLWCFETKTLLSKTGLKGKLQEKCAFPKLFLILKKNAFLTQMKKKQQQLQT